MSKNPKTKKLSISRNQSTGPTLIVCVMLVLLGVIVFGQLYDADFVHYDDSDYIVENEHIQEGFTAESIKWAFISGYASNWHPVTWLSHMLDFKLFGMKAGGYHIGNLLLHLINSVLVFLIFKRMTKGFWKSAFVAALFVIHPGHVESVAWVSERKDVLSSMFWFLTMWAYLFYTEKRTVKWYLLMLISYAIGLMAKPMLVTLPFVLLLLDYWPLERFEKFSWKNLGNVVFEKVPFFLLAAASSIVTYFVQQKGGAMVDMSVIAPAIRVANCVISYAKYLQILVWPTDLGVFYPYSWEQSSMSYAAAGAMLLIVITILAMLFGRRNKYLIVGWFWYLGTMVPVIGLVQVGMQSMADRYTYLPFIGLFVMIAWGIGDLSANWQNRKPAAGMAMGIVILVLSACTWVQAGYWHDSVTLFEHTLKVTEGPTVNNGRIHNNLSVVYNRREEFDKAIEHGQKAALYDPDSANSHYNLGIAYYRTGQVDKAIACWLETVRLNPNYNQAHNNLGALYYAKGQSDLKIKQFDRAREQFDLAIKHWKKALEINPDDKFARDNLNSAMKEIGEEK